MRDLKELKKLLTVVFSLSLLNAGGFDYLNEENRNILSTQKEINKLSSQKLKRNWIEPVVASYTYTKGESVKSEFYKVSLSQPVFKSGGIYFAIKYADANSEFVSLATSIEQNSLIKRVYELVLNLKKLDLQLKKSELELKNISLDIKRKKQRFLSGDDDVSFLNQAMISRNNILLKLEELKTTKEKLVNSFQNISSYSYHDIKLPTLELISKRTFLRKNLELKKQKADIAQKNQLKNMTISNYLPTVSLFGNYNYQKTKAKVSNKWQKDEFKNYGVMISMPISINEGRDMEIRKLEVIKAKISLKQKRKELKNEYKNIYLDLKTLKNKHRVLRESISLYSKLVKRTKDALRAGDKTKLDLDTVKNSKRVFELDDMIVEYDKKLKLLELFEKMGGDL